jgi:hypothetical protein
MNADRRRWGRGTCPTKHPERGEVGWVGSVCRSVGSVTAFFFIRVHLRSSAVK